MLFHLLVNYSKDVLPQFEVLLLRKQLIEVRPVQGFDFRVSCEVCLCNDRRPLLSESTGEYTDVTLHLKTAGARLVPPSEVSPHAYSPHHRVAFSVMVGDTLLYIMLQLSCTETFPPLL